MLTLKASREADSECGRHALTATSPALPAADDLVQLIAR
jgi:hypothetical protein